MSYDSCSTTPTKRNKKSYRSRTKDDIDFLSIPPPPPQLQSKLNTNYIPSTTETEELRTYLDNLSDKLTTYDDQLAALESKLHALKLGRREIQRTFTVHNALLSPVRRLPPEVLQHIFAWCLPQTRNCVMHASEAPLLLGRVCSDWRKLSMSTHELWSKLHIVPPTVNYALPLSSIKAFKRKRRLVKMWLDRSGACPLSLSIVWLAGESADEKKLCSILLDLIKPLCGRWKSLDLEIPFCLLAPFKSLKPADVPMLQSITLMDNRATSVHGIQDRWQENLGFIHTGATTTLRPNTVFDLSTTSAADEAHSSPTASVTEVTHASLSSTSQGDLLPSLRSFSLTYFSGSIPLPTLPSRQLTSLYLEANVFFYFLDAPAMLNFLRECTMLRDLTLKFPLPQVYGDDIIGGGVGAPIPSYSSTYKVMQRIASISHFAGNNDNDDSHHFNGNNKGKVVLEHLESLSVDGDQHLYNTFHMSNVLEFVVAPRLKKLEVSGRSRGWVFDDEQEAGAGMHDEEGDTDEELDEEQTNILNAPLPFPPSLASYYGVQVNANANAAATGTNTSDPPPIPPDPVSSIRVLLQQSLEYRNRVNRGADGSPLEMERLVLESITLSSPLPPTPHLAPAVAPVVGTSSGTGQAHSNPFTIPNLADLESISANGAALPPPLNAFVPQMQARRAQARALNARNNPSRAQSGSPHTLVDCLRLMPELREFLLHNWVNVHLVHHHHQQHHHLFAQMPPYGQGHTGANGLAAGEDEDEEDEEGDEERERNGEDESAQGRRWRRGTHAYGCPLEQHGHEVQHQIVAEDIILQALTVPSAYVDPRQKEGEIVEGGQSSENGGDGFEVEKDEEILCPDLQLLDMTLNAGSQRILGAFVESRCSGYGSRASSTFKPRDPASSAFAKGKGKGKGKMPAVVQPAPLKTLKINISASSSHPDSIELKKLVGKYKPRNAKPKSKRPKHGLYTKAGKKQDLKGKGKAEKSKHDGELHGYASSSFSSSMSEISASATDSETDLDDGVYASTANSDGDSDYQSDEPADSYPGDAALNANAHALGLYGPYRANGRRRRRRGARYAYMQPDRFGYPGYPYPSPFSAGAGEKAGEEGEEGDGGYRYAGLEATLTYQPAMGCCEEVEPSPWTGLAGDVGVNA